MIFHYLDFVSAASQGQKKLLQDKLQDYAAGLQDGLKMAATNVSDPTQQRFQQVGVNFVAGGSGSAVGSQGPEDAYQYFTVPSPGGPVQVSRGGVELGRSLFTVEFFFGGGISLLFVRLFY